MILMPKKMLIIGYSSFVRKRVIKSLKRIENLDIFICSKSHKINRKKKIFYNDYDKALKAKSFDYIYISLVNNLHFYYAKLALNLGYNVIVDKPITTSYSETNQLLKIAKKKNVLLCELMIFNYHSAFDKIIKLIGGEKKIETIQANFNIPLTKPIKDISNINGGCNYDMGPYAAAIIRIFFNKNFQKSLILKKNFKKSKSKVIKEFSLLVQDKSKKFYGNFAISKEYISNLIFFGNDKIIEIPFQAFALPSSKKINIIIKSKNKKYTIKLKNDYIKKFFNDIINSKFIFNHYYKKIDLDNKIKKKLGLIN
jgi:predicted dehydrogenase